MPEIQQLPAWIRLLFSFAVVLFLIRKEISLGNVFVLGAIGVALLFDLPLTKLLYSLLNSIIYPKTVMLCMLVGLILILSKSMELSGQMQRMLQKFKGLIRNEGLNLVIFPALIGLLPMPGGAVFSAPMVKALGTDSKLSADRLSYINYWFRHIWEYWWPLYPCVLLATVLSNEDLWTIVFVIAPVTPISFLIGYRTLRKLRTDQRSRYAPPSTRPSVVPFAVEMIPILITIGLGLGLGVVFSTLMPQMNTAREIGLDLALCLAIGFVWYKNRFGRKQIKQVLSNSQVPQMIYLILSVMVFKGVLQDSDAVQEIARELLAYRVPLFGVALVLPFIVGVITGLAVAFVAVGFPILIPVISAYGEANHLLAYIQMVMISGMVGVIMSPLHICFILTNQYFSVPMIQVYKHFYINCLILVLCSIGYFWLLRTVW